MATRRTTDSSRNIPTLQPPTEPPTAAPAAPAPRKRAAKTAAPKATPVETPPRIEISDDARRGMIAEAAYLRAETRGFSGGRELEIEDWLAAEAEVDALLQSEHSRH